MLSFKSKNADGSLNCTSEPLTDSNKPKAFIHWVADATAVDVKINDYEKLFKSAMPEAVPGGFLKDIASNTKSVLSAKIDKYLVASCMENVNKKRESEYTPVPKLSFQFERNGYFTVDRGDTKANGTLFFNKTVSLKEDKQK